MGIKETGARWMIGLTVAIFLTPEDESFYYQIYELVHSW